ncbi:MAG: ankyrin repeat domain-containing protein [Parachlamydiaceae bacterium]|nr:ankyrin repeat domain-containing protein [Parachlamydiaceae bacterium]
MEPSVETTRVNFVNQTSAKIDKLKKQRYGYLSRIDCLGAEMRETISLIIEIAETKIKIFQILLSKPIEERNFDEAQNLFHISIQKISHDCVKDFESLLDARDSIMERSVPVELTNEKKREVLASFAEYIEFTLQSVQFKLDPLSDLEKLKMKEEKEHHVQLALFEQLLKSKTELTNQFEEKSYEIHHICNQKEVFSIWEASEAGDIDFLKSQIDVLPIWEKWWAIEKFINQRNSDGHTMLSLAVAHTHLDCVKFLLKNKANPNLPDNKKYCPIHWAARNGQVEIAIELVNAKASINTCGEYNRTPLNMAAFHGKTDMVLFLIENGADINAQTDEEDGCLAILHTAIMQGHMNIIIELAKQPRLNVNVVDTKQHSPLYYAINLGRADIAALIIGHISWKCPKDPGDPNHIIQLLKINPMQNKEQIKKFLERNL